MTRSVRAELARPETRDALWAVAAGGVGAALTWLAAPGTTIWGYLLIFLVVTAVWYRQAAKWRARRRQAYDL